MSTTSIKPSKRRPRELTPEQRREFVGGIESEGFCYYFIGSPSQGASLRQ